LTDFAEIIEVFEYLGDFWHGYPCMPNINKSLLNTGNSDGQIRGNNVKVENDRRRQIQS
jgi:hypothetical protein